METDLQNIQLHHYLAWLVPTYLIFRVSITFNAQTEFKLALDVWEPIFMTIQNNLLELTHFKVHSSL